MRKTKRKPSQSEALKRKWSIRIMLEKEYTQECAQWMAQRLEELIDHMRYGHAAIAYRKQNGEFRLVTGTLIYYRQDFHKLYDINKIEGAVAYWDVEKQAWRTFQVENFMEWKPIV
ncbi:SH3 beta-barrel fold-containing protein [Bacteroides sp.]